MPSPFVGSVSGSANDADASLTDTMIKIESASDVGGCRFQNVTVPAGATVTAAYVTVEVSNSSRDEPDLLIYGEDVDDSDTFSSPGDMPADRTTTTASTAWVSSNLGAPGTFQTPSIVSVVQEIINRGGWASGNAMTILFAGQSSTDFAFSSVDGGTAAELTIVYEEDEEEFLSIFVSDGMGFDAQTSRSADRHMQTQSDGLGFTDYVSVGKILEISVTDNLGFDDNVTTPLDQVSSGTLELLVVDNMGFSEGPNTAVAPGFLSVIIVDGIGFDTLAGNPVAPSANWTVSLETDIMFGCSTTESQSHAGITVLAGHRYRR